MSLNRADKIKKLASAIKDYRGKKNANSAEELNCAIKEHIKARSSDYCQYMRATDVVCIRVNAEVDRIDEGDSVQ